MNTAIASLLSRHNYKFKQNQQAAEVGFTLIELMVTIAVLAIIVAIAAPNVSTQLADQRMKSTVATIENALTEAKSESIIRRQNVTVNFDDSSSVKKITINATDTAASPIASYSYHARSTIKPSSVTTVFEPNRRVTTARTYTVCDSDTNATPRQISVSKVANITTKQGGSCP